jgi:hypothetical protein
MSCHCNAQAVAERAQLFALPLSMITQGDEYQGAAGLDEEGAGAPALDDPAAKQQPAGVEGLGDDDFGIEGDDADDLA